MKITCEFMNSALHGLSMFSFLLEIDSLVFFSLIRLETQFQKPQRQIRKLTLKILFQNHFGYTNLFFSGLSRGTETVGHIMYTIDL